MVYVSSEGTVCSSQPWSLRRVFQMFYGLFAFVIYFFTSLVGLEGRLQNNTGSSGGSSFRGSGDRGGGGGGGPYGPGGGGGGGGPSGRFRTMGDINRPTVSAGGCPGGSCGM